MQRKLFSFVLLIMTILLTSCAKGEYNGKEISSIHFIRVKYLGGYQNEQLIDFSSNEVLARGFLPSDDEVIPEYEVKYTFEKDNIKPFLDELQKSGLFNIKDKYRSPGGIMDGSGWSLIINYSDGSAKKSTGDNNSPTRVFRRADYAFYNLCGSDFFGTLPSNYKYPPAMYIAYEYSYGNATTSNGTSLACTNAIWNKYKVEGINNIEYAINKQEYNFIKLYNYSFVLWTANDEFRFSKLEIKSYDLHGNDEKIIATTKWFKQKEWNIEFNRVYLVTITYPQGICEYAFSTVLSD